MRSCTLRRRFRPRLESVPEARHVAARFLSDQPQAIRDSVELAVAELATNAIVHARTDFELEMKVFAHSVRVSVADASHAGPRFYEQPLFASHGRGLPIVQSISDRLGIDWRPGRGKSVWFEIQH